MKVVVTGGRGFIGRTAARMLQQRGHAVTNCDRLPPLPETRPNEWGRQVVADVTQAGDIWPLMAGQEAVVHCAGIPEAGILPDAVVFHHNVDGVFHVLSAAHALGVRRVVLASSATLLGFDGLRPPPMAFLPADETHPLRPVHVYSLSKRIGEELAEYTAQRAPAMCIWSLRLCLVLGADNWEREGRPRLRSPDLGARHLFAYVWVDDVADLVGRCLEGGPSLIPGHHPMYVAASDSLSEEPLETIRRRYFPQAAWRGGTALVDCGRARELVGFAPTRSWRQHRGCEEEEKETGA